jgi:hypothetical protein
MIDKYIEAGIILTETALNGDYKKGNIVAQKNRKLFEVLAHDKVLAMKVLTQVMISDNDSARSMAAADLLRLNIMTDQAASVLTEVAKRTDIIGFEAMMALKIWKGEISGKAL